MGVTQFDLTVIIFNSLVFGKKSFGINKILVPLKQEYYSAFFNTLKLYV